MQKPFSTRQIIILLVIRSSNPLGIPSRQLVAELVHRRVPCPKLEFIQRHVRADIPAVRTSVLWMTWFARGRGILLPSFFLGLIIPTFKPSPRQSIPAHSPGPLAPKHLVMDVREIPTLIGFFDERCKDVPNFRGLTSGQVLQLVGIRPEVEQLRRINRASNEFPRAPPDHHQRCNGTFTCIFAVHRIIGDIQAVCRLKVWEK